MSDAYRFVFVIAIAAGAGALMIWLGVTGSRADRSRETACRQAGGIYFAPRNGHVCLKRDAVIELN